MSKYLEYDYYTINVRKTHSEDIRLNLRPTGDRAAWDRLFSWLTAPIQGESKTNSSSHLNNDVQDSESDFEDHRHRPKRSPGQTNTDK